MKRATSRASVKTGMLMLATLGLAQCDRDRAAPAPAAPTPPAPIAASTELSRAGMIAALARAASAFAAGADPSAASGLAGRTFRVRLPFGCSGPATEDQAVGDGLAGWSWAEERDRLTLAVRPVDWSASPLVTPPGASPDWDGVEGFWIARPWLSQDACPAPVERLAPPPPPETAPAAGAAESELASPAALPSPASPQTMGLAAIRAPESSRLGRRDGEAYRFVVRGTDGGPPIPPMQGYRLVLGGRVGAFPDGRAVRCTSQTADQRPACVAAVELDVVAFEDASGARLSEWRPT